MQTPEAVLFPRPRVPKVTEQQNAARQALTQTIINSHVHIKNMYGGDARGVSVGSIGVQASEQEEGTVAETKG